MPNSVPDGVRQQFAHFISEARYARRLSTEEFAAFIGFARTYVSRLEHGLVNVTCRVIDELLTSLIDSAGPLEGTANTVALRIRSRREDAGITMEQLATAAGVTVQSIGRIERRVANAEIDTIEKLAVGLGCSALDLIAPMEAVNPRLPARKSESSKEARAPLKKRRALTSRKIKAQRKIAQPKRKTAKEYEYKTVEIRTDGGIIEHSLSVKLDAFSSTLNTEGQDGWLLVQIIPAVFLPGEQSQSNSNIYAVFQREKTA